MDDEPKVQQLENRIDSLESTIEKMMPSRRDALKMGGAALAGGSLMAGTASAGTNQVGTIGSASQPVDIESEDINNADTVTTQDLVVNGTATGVAQDLQACRVFLSSRQNITANTDTKIQFDSEVHDTGNNFDTSANDFTCPKTGLYLVVLQGKFATGSNGDTRQLSIGTSTNHDPSGEGAQADRRVSQTLDTFTTTTLNKYNQGDTIAGYARNINSDDEMVEGSDSDVTFLEVAFFGSL
jgi:hypothetical protein